MRGILRSTPSRRLSSAVATVVAAAALPAVLLAGPSAEADPPAPASREALRPHTLTTGHIDLFEVTYDASRSGLQLLVKDDTELYSPSDDAIYTTPEDVTVAVDSSLAALEIPEDLPPSYDFLGEPGNVVYDLPFTQNYDIPWPGWSTERLLGTLPAGVQLAPQGDQRQVQLTLDVQTPPGGRLHLFQIDGAGEPIAHYVDTTDDVPDVIPMGDNSHVHTEWSFSTPGTYAITATARATTTTGQVLTSRPTSYSIVVAPAAEFAPVSTSAPTVTGTPRPGSTLTGTPGTWNPVPHTDALQWLRDGQPLDGATGPTYVVTPADVGHALSVREDATVGSAPGTSTSIPVTVTNAATPSASPSPTPIPTTLPSPTPITSIPATLPVVTAAPPVPPAPPATPVVPTSTSLALRLPERVIGRDGRARLVLTFPPGATPTGAVKVRSGGRTLATVPAAAGRTTVRLPRLAPGRYRITVRYLGDSHLAATRSPARTLTVR